MIPELKDCILDHIAIAVNDIEESVSQYTKLGLKFDDKREIVESQKVKTAFCHIDENSHLELLEPTEKESNIQRFIDKKGPGIHHLCFRVENIINKQSELEEQGIKFIYKEPFPGANNCLVNFIHPKSMNGVLIELSERIKG